MVTILQSCLSFLIPKTMFKGVSLSVHTVSILNSFYDSPLLLPSHPHYSPLDIFYLHRSNVFRYYWLSSILFSFPPPPSSVGWLHCYKYVLHVFAYDCVWFCVYVYFLVLLSTYGRTHAAFIFLSLAYFAYMMSSYCIHLSSNHVVSCFLIRIKPYCVCIPHFLGPHIIVQVSLLYPDLRSFR
jgi:hypothetical protein